MQVIILIRQAVTKLEGTNRLRPPSVFWFCFKQSTLRERSLRYLVCFLLFCSVYPKWDLCNHIEAVSCICEHNPGDVVCVAEDYDLPNIRWLFDDDCCLLLNDITTFITGNIVFRVLTKRCKANVEAPKEF